MTRPWSDGKKFIFEDLVIYSLLASGDLMLDFFPNFLYRIGFRKTPYPFSFGIFQILILLFFMIQILRKLSAWRYYR